MALPSSRPAPNHHRWLGDDASSNQFDIGVQGDSISFAGGPPAFLPLASENQQAVGEVTTQGDNTGTPSAGLSFIGGDQSAAIMNDFASVRRDISALQVLVDQLRAELVTLNLVKGEA